MDYFSAAAGGNAAGGKHPGSGGVGLCSRERFKQLLRGLWRTHFTEEQAESLADRYLVSAGHYSGKVRHTIYILLFLFSSVTLFFDLRIDIKYRPMFREGVTSFLFT